MPDRDSRHDRRYVDRRTVLGTVGAGMVGLAGCTDDGGDGGGDDGGDDGGQDDGTDGGGGDGEEIAVTGVWTGGEEEDFLAVADHVQEETGIDITYHPRTTDELLTGTLMDYQSGVAAADVVVMPSPARVRSDGEQGHLEPLGDVWEEDQFAAEPDQVAAGEEVYAAPFKMDLKPGFWYRQSFFDEHGLEEPEDYDGFIALLDEIDGIDGVDSPIASGNGEGWPLSDVTEAFFLRQDDGTQLQEDLIAGEAEFTDDRVYAAFEEIQELLLDGYFSEVRDFGVQFEYFWENQIPLYFQGSFTPAFEAIEDPDDLDVFRLPGTESIVATVNWFTVPTYSESTDAATQAVEEFVSADGQQVWAERGGFIASNLEVPAEAYEIEIMQQLSEMAAEVTLVPDLDDALGDPFQSEFWSQLTGLWAEPDRDVDSMIQQLDQSHQDTVEGDDEE